VTSVALPPPVEADPTPISVRAEHGEGRTTCDDRDFAPPAGTPDSVASRPPAEEEARRIDESPDDDINRKGLPGNAARKPRNVVGEKRREGTRRRPRSRWRAEEAELVRDTQSRLTT